MPPRSAPAAEATSKWRTPEDVRSHAGLIGPNAVLQYQPIIERLGGTDRVDEMLASSGIFNVPDGSEMIDEGVAARLHRQVRIEEPDLAPLLAAAAGAGTADYILRNRIPRGVRLILRLLPAALAAPLLARAIERHAWTFAGSGTFRMEGPWKFAIAQNPLVRGEEAGRPICHWHCAVFEHLYRALVAPDCRCREIACCAQSDSDVCVFEITREGRAGA